ncbi:MAG: glycosyltransferase family 39 protein [Bacteroidales bacterium]|nr:glycosyltransferase family 39 protein [Bacteroidales bacterium]
MIKHSGLTTSNPSIIRYGVVLLTALHFTWLLSMYAPAISTPDAQGYYTQARIIARTGKTCLEPESVTQYIGPHWHHAGLNRYYTTFAPGFPLLMSLLYSISPALIFLLNPLLASLILPGIFLAFRRSLGNGGALMAAFMVACLPFFNEHALFGDAHIAAAFFTIWSLAALQRYFETGSVWWALPAGLMAGFIPVIRYPEILLTIGIIVYALFTLHKRKMHWLSAAAFFGGVVIPLAFLAVRNHSTFGAFWQTGYFLPPNRPLFGLQEAVNHFPQYVSLLMSEGVGPLFILGLTGMILALTSSNGRPSGTMFLLLTIPSLILYVSLAWRVDGQSMRFLIPTFPFWSAAAVYLIFRLTPEWNKSRIVWVSVTLVAVLLWGLPQSFRKMEGLHRQQTALSGIARWISEQTRPGDLIVAGEGVCQQLDTYGRWKLADIRIPSPPLLKHPGLPEGQPPAVTAIRNADAQKRYETLTGPARLNTFLRDVRQWAGHEGRVLFVLEPEAYTHLSRALTWTPGLKILGRYEASGPADTLCAPATLNHPPNHGPQGPDHVFDLRLSQSLILAEWLRQPWEMTIEL